MIIYEVIKKPFVTEKTTTEKDERNVVAFVVNKDANKIEIKEAVEKLFKVSVEGVHTSIMPGKLRRMGAHAGFRSDWKKAIVKLKKGQEIKMVEEV